MDYRMYSGGAEAGENVVTLIKDSLFKEGGIRIKTPLKFVGFEGTAGTSFRLNNHAEKMVIPSTGSFITPFSGQYYCHVFSLIFDEAFTGNIYYII